MPENTIIGILTEAAVQSAVSSMITAVVSGSDTPMALQVSNETQYNRFNRPELRERTL